MAKPGCETISAIKSLADKLDFPFDKSMQEWSIQVAEKNQFEQYLSFYDSLSNEHEKYIVMWILVPAAEEWFEANGSCRAWDRIQQRLIWDFSIHEQIIRLWGTLEKDKTDSGSPITSDFRELLRQSETPKMKILFVCTINVMRSATANEIYRHDMRFDVRSAGTHRSAETVISKELLDWAELVVVMEEHHLNFIHKMNPGIAKSKSVVSLDIPDNYDYMQAELIALLRFRFEVLIPGPPYFFFQL